MRINAAGNADKYYSESEFPEGPCELLAHVSQYLHWYSASGHQITDVLTDVSSQSILTFDPTRTTDGRSSSYDDLTNQTKSDVTRETKANHVKVRLQDYPKFSGKTHEWKRFYEAFTPVASLDDIEDLLDKDPDHEEKFKTDTEHQEQCRYLYNILKVACADSLALPKIVKYKSNKDGYSAWQNLYQHYHAHGNADSHASAQLSEIKALRLFPNSPGGMDRFLGRFEFLALELQDKDPLSENQKRIFLLEGVQDPHYKEIITLCRAQNYDYEKCLLELRRESQEHFKIKQKPPDNRKMFYQGVDSNADIIGQSTDKLYRIPKFAWDRMTQHQKTLYMEAVKKMKEESRQGQDKDDKRKEGQDDDNPTVQSRMMALMKNMTDKDVEEQGSNKNSHAGDIWKTVIPKSSKNFKPYSKTVS